MTIKSEVADWIQATYKSEIGISRTRAEMLATGVIQLLKDKLPKEREHHDLDPIPWGNEAFVRGYNSAIKEVHKLLGDGDD